jgi:hypothetical protein
MSLTRKHFTRFAAVFAAKLSSEQDPVRMNAWYELACSFCIVLKEANPAFNRDKFLDACGFTPERGFER